MNMLHHFLGTISCRLPSTRVGLRFSPPQGPKPLDGILGIHPIFSLTAHGFALGVCWLPLGPDTSTHWE